MTGYKVEDLEKILKFMKEKGETHFLIERPLGYSFNTLVGEQSPYLKLHLTKSEAVLTVHLDQDMDQTRFRWKTPSITETKKL
jgi:hypothetical protein